VCWPESDQAYSHRLFVSCAMASMFKRLCLFGLAPLALAAVLPSTDVGLVERDTACTNGPFTRACWKSGYRYFITRSIRCDMAMR
jgi:hypothetical protein